MTRVFASWSGGKDCCLSVYRAINAGLEAGCLANMVSEDRSRSRSHDMPAGVIREQAKALGIPVHQQPTADDDYRNQFIAMLRKFREDGITGGVFGDIDFNPHREWVESVCNETGMTLYLPLWLEDQNKLMEEFIDAGFVSVVVAVLGKYFGPEYIGRTIDQEFLAEVQSMGKDVTPCGEAGEYHTLVVDGPIFRSRLEITESQTVTRGEHHFLDIRGTKIVEKSAV